MHSLRDLLLEQRLSGPYLLKVTDPAGGTSKLVFDVHKYLDSDNSGTHAECTTVG